MKEENEDLNLGHAEEFQLEKNLKELNFKVSMLEFVYNDIYSKMKSFQENFNSIEKSIEKRNAFYEFVLNDLNEKYNSLKS